MPSNEPVAERLLAAVESHALVRIERTPRNANLLTGFVLAVGSKWVLISRTGDGGYLDEGLVAVRGKHITKVREDSSFEGRFARTQPGWPPVAPAALDLDTTSGLIRDLGKVSPLVGIEQERRFDSEMVWIGIVDEVGDGWLWLHEVRPDASWREQPFGYKLRRITKVTVSDRYQLALASIAGTPR